MTNLKDALHIPDTQSERDQRHLVIQHVGVKSVRYPLQLRMGSTVLPTVASWSLDVALPAEEKGTHCRDSSLGSMRWTSRSMPPNFAPSSR